MKLAQKYNRANLLTSLIILVLSGAVYYFGIHYILTDKLDTDLQIEEAEIMAYANKYDKLPFAGDFKDQKVIFHVLPKDAVQERSFGNAVYYNEDEKEEEPGRMLVTAIDAGGKKYKVTITKSSLEAEDLVRLIFLITLTVIVLLLLSLMVINRFVLSRLWQPFYALLTQLRNFNLADQQEFIVQPSQIEEFEELNQSVLVMAKQARQDYKELKSFTDNASHEIMTPLAVINSKLDTLIQTDTLSDQQGELIEDVYLAVNRLSRLNQSLLLLAKIENDLIGDEEDIDLELLTRQKIRQFNELLVANRLSVVQQLSPCKLYMNKQLADVLLNNLISNAIRHNHPQGEITIHLTQERFTMINTGLETALDDSRAFERFYKNPSSEGTGLGLAITSQICNLYHFKLMYSFTAGKHGFVIAF